MGGVLKKSKRLGPVKQIAENNETAAAMKMNQSLQAQQESLAQLKKLKEYRNDYTVQFKTKGQVGMSASRLLDQAIEEHSKTVQSLQEKLGQHQQAFKKTNSRKKVVEKLIEKSKQHELRETGRLEQNESDDRMVKGFELD